MSAVEMSDSEPKAVNCEVGLGLPAGSMAGQQATGRAVRRPAAFTRNLRWVSLCRETRGDRTAGQQEAGNWS